MFVWAWSEKSQATRETECSDTTLTSLCSPTDLDLARDFQPKYPMHLITDALAMIRAIRAQEGFIGKWGGLLNIPQIIGGLVFLLTPEGLAVLLTNLFTLAVAGQIHKRDPFSRLTGICHAPWLILLPWLLWRIVTAPHSTLMTLWLSYVSVTIAISLVFDGIAVYRFRKGNRTFAWAK